MFKHVFVKPLEVEISCLFSRNVVAFHLLLTCVVMIAKTIDTSQFVLLQQNWLYVGLRTLYFKMTNICRKSAKQTQRTAAI